MNQEHWRKVLDWPLDDPTASRPFSRRLQEANEWDLEFTQQAVEEYRKFMFLKTVTDKPLTPSVVVDSVWHMHLLYSRNYRQFCEMLLGKGRFVDHNPGKGGEGESEKFKRQYFDTILVYMDHFDEPPKNIWGLARRIETGSAE